MRHTARLLYLRLMNLRDRAPDRGEVSIATAVLAVLFVIIAVALAAWATTFISGWESNAPTGPGK